MSEQTTETTYMYVPGLDWMQEANFTPTIWVDTLHKMCHLTGCTYREAEQTIWQAIQLYETTYGLELYLTGQVFADPCSLTWELIKDKEFWEGLIQDVIETLYLWLEEGDD